MLTFGQVKESRLKEVVNSCRDSEDFRSLLNEATQALLERGDWRGTLQPIRVCVNNGCITWPRLVHSVRKLNIFHREIQVENLWWQFIDRDFYSNWIGLDYWNVVRPLVPREHQSEMDAVGYFSTYNDVPSVSFIQVYPTVPEDVGKTVTIFGKDLNGVTLRTKNAQGTYTDGCVIIMQLPFAQSPIALQPGPIRVLKQETLGDVRLYSFDAVNGNTLDLGVYAPTEITPSYSRYKLHVRHNCGDGCKMITALALVKLEFIPVKCDSDIVLIDNRQALKSMCQSIKYKEAKDFSNATAFMADAVHELNLQLQNETPDFMTPVLFKSFGTARPHRHSIGRII